MFNIGLQGTCLIIFIWKEWLFHESIVHHHVKLWSITQGKEIEILITTAAVEQKGFPWLTGSVAVWTDQVPDRPYNLILNEMKMDTV